ncbi:hypothetical protein SBDP1_1400010 [Syntrophobacter sp. SbD1]|nr:hypothetical protein SBDP1_1400010 [Syntrophobacter sp. SbD1]
MPVAATIEAKQHIDNYLYVHASNVNNEFNTATKIDAFLPPEKLFSSPCWKNGSPGMRSS